MNRRDALHALALAPGVWLPGCISLRPFASASIAGEPPSDLRQILKPDRVYKSALAPASCIDVHAHFFNASDVPVRGFLEGPVAHSLDEPLAGIVRALAPFADALAGLAPTAPTEFAELLELASPVAALTRDQHQDLQERIDKDRRRVSNGVFEILRNSPFAAQFNRLKTSGSARLSGVLAEESAAFGPDTVQRAMQRGTERSQFRAQSVPGREVPAYVDGVMAFVGYMLSYRWMNLVAYQQAFSTSPNAFGIDQVFGALVDFDQWLDGPPRSSHEDQIKLHQLLSQLSGGYMRPLVAYNPWTDVASPGKALSRVVDAVTNRGFVGVKIYPPMGFRPLGNTEDPVPSTWRSPSPAALDQALLALWLECGRLDIPVMAHSGESMGTDDEHEKLAGPKGWSALLKRFQGLPPPLVNAGHFGGDDAKNDWSVQLAELMATPEGASMYADLGYWSALRCDGTEGSCSAEARLGAVLKRNPQTAQRIMYGSDWLMLSRERDWGDYPEDIARSTQGLLRPEELFGTNARRCFSRAFRTPAPV
jgi:predicted TIM-barrel fold metal-dependent hydrolase